MNLKSLLTGVVIALSMSVSAFAQQEAVKFNVLPLEGDGISANVESAIQRKLVTAFDRSKASTESVYNVFAICPEYSFTDAAETEGLVREVGTVAVDLTLSAINVIDNEIYYSVTIPLKGASTGGKEAAIKNMANSIKVTDPVFVRFVRNARQRIADYFAENCANIIVQAKRLVDLKKYHEAAALIVTIAPTVSCYDEAATLLNEILPYITEPEDGEVPADTVIIERVIEVPVERVVEVPSTPDTVVIDRVVEVPVPQPAPAAPSVDRPEIVIDSNFFDFEIVSCKGDLSRQSIVIEVLMKNRDKDHSEGHTWTNFYTAIDDKGNELNHLKYRDGGTSSVRLPYNVELRSYYTINKVTEKFSKLSFVEFRFSWAKVKVSNLTINWK